MLGNVFPHDAFRIPPLEVNQLYLKHRTRAGGILIVHDRPWQPETLRRALPYIRDELNIQLCTLDHLHNIVQQHNTESNNTESNNTDSNNTDSNNIEILNNTEAHAE